MSRWTAPPLLYSMLQKPKMENHVNKLNDIRVAFSSDFFDKLTLTIIRLDFNSIL